MSMAVCTVDMSIHLIVQAIITRDMMVVTTATLLHASLEGTTIWNLLLTTVHPRDNTSNRALAVGLVTTAT